MLDAKLVCPVYREIHPDLNPGVLVSGMVRHIRNLGSALGSAEFTAWHVEQLRFCSWNTFKSPALVNVKTHKASGVPSLRILHRALVTLFSAIGRVLNVLLDEGVGKLPHVFGSTDGFLEAISKNSGLQRAAKTTGLVFSSLTPEIFICMDTLST